MQTQKKKAKKDEDSNNEVAHVRRSSCHEHSDSELDCRYAAIGTAAIRDPRPSVELRTSTTTVRDRCGSRVHAEKLN